MRSADIAAPPGMNARRRRRGTSSNIVIDHAMFVATPVHRAALLWQQIAGRLSYETRRAALNAVGRKKRNAPRQRQSAKAAAFRSLAERAIGKQAAAVPRAAVRH